MTLTFRDTKGSNLIPDEVDANFRDLDTRVSEIEDNPPAAVPPSNMIVSGTQWTIHYPDGLTFGPFTLPQANFRPSVGAEISASAHSVEPGNANGFLYLSNAGGCDVLFDDDSFAVDAEITFYADTDGPVTFDSSTDIELRVPDGFLKQIKGNGFSAGFKKRSAGLWVGIGTFAEDVTA